MCLVSARTFVDAVPVADCTFTSIERKRIDAIAFELSDVAAEFFADARPAISDEEWHVLSDFAAAAVRRALEVAPLLHAIVDMQPCSLPYPGRGRETFVRAGLAAWRDSFAPIREPWRLAPIFAKVPGGEARILADVSALEVMAANRMFSSLDDQCAALLAQE